MRFCLAPGSGRYGFGAQNETPVAIAAYDEVLIAHFEINPRMAERAFAPVAGDACAGDDDRFRRFCAHAVFFRESFESGAIIAGKAATATLCKRHHSRGRATRARPPPMLARTGQPGKAMIAVTVLANGAGKPKAHVFGSAP